MVLNVLMRMAASALLLALITVTANGQEAPAPWSCEILDRACWIARRATVEGDGDQISLGERATKCNELLMQLQRAADAAQGHLCARHMTFSPSGRGCDPTNPTRGVGYINPGEYVDIEREITLAVTVAVRDINALRFDGANLQRCEAVVASANQRIQQIVDALP